MNKQAVPPFGAGYYSVYERQPDLRKGGELPAIGLNIHQGNKKKEEDYSTVKRILHWTPRYILNRISVFCYRRIYPDRPWLTPDANAILSSWLRKTDVGVEFGSGKSTLWFASRVKFLWSIEHDAG